MELGMAKIESDPGRRAALAQRSCTLGYEGGCYLAAIGTDGPSRIEWAIRGCLLNQPDTCEIALMNAQRRRGTAEQLQRVYSLMSERCAAEDHDTCLIVSDLLASGIGVEKDLVQARHILERECDVGTKWACSTLAVDLHTGKFGTVDEAGSRRYVERACGDKVGTRQCAPEQIIRWMPDAGRPQDPS
jgi:TPR repeat protein